MMSWQCRTMWLSGCTWSCRKECWPGAVDWAFLAGYADRCYDYKCTTATHFTCALSWREVTATSMVNYSLQLSRMRVNMFCDSALNPWSWCRSEETPSEYIWSSLIVIHPTSAPKFKIWIVPCVVSRCVNDGEIWQNFTLRLFKQLGTTPVRNTVSMNLHHPTC